MKTLDVEQYERAYSYTEYLEARTYSDMLTVLSNDYLSSVQRFNEFKLDRRKRRFSNDEKQSVFHEIAKQIEVGLDASLRQFRAKLLTPVDVQLLNDNYFNKKFTKDDENDTSANILRNKLTACKKFIEAFQSRHPIELKRSYWYENGRLYIGNSEHLKYMLESYRDKLLEILFSDYSVRHKNFELLEKLAKVLPDHTDFFNKNNEYQLMQLKSHCDGINKRVRKKSGTEARLIIHERGITALNPHAFEVIDQAKFVKTDQ